MPTYRDYGSRVSLVIKISTSIKRRILISNPKSWGINCNLKVKKEKKIPLGTYSTGDTFFWKIGKFLSTMTNHQICGHIFSEFHNVSCLLLFFHINSLSIHYGSNIFQQTCLFFLWLQKLVSIEFFGLCFLDVPSLEHSSPKTYCWGKKIFKSTK